MATTTGLGSNTINGDAAHADSADAAVPKLTSEEAECAIQSLVEMIQFETISATAPETGQYRACAEWIVRELDHHLGVGGGGFLNRVWILEESPEHSPVVVAAWLGENETLPVVLLNSHYDVVPADLTAWTMPPFEGARTGAVSDDTKKIFGRGAQDMKSVCVQYIHALKKIHTLDPTWKPQRSIYLTFVPDEEIGGSGMACFLESTTYKSLPEIALALDEGLASETDVYSLFYGERLPWWVSIKAMGPTGHGSRFIDNTAVEQLIEMANKALAFREGQRQQLGLSKHENCAHAVAAANKTKNGTTRAAATTTRLGDVTSLNITSLQAGVRVGDTYAYNCVPPIATCTFDIRISPHTDPSEIKSMLNTWCQECSRNMPTSQVTWEYVKHGNDAGQHATTSLDPDLNPWYEIFQSALHSIGLDVEPEVFPAATDSRFLRALGIRAFGFSPMRNTPILLHENDEYIPESTFLEGIGVYVTLIKALASATP